MENLGTMCTGDGKNDLPFGSSGDSNWNFCMPTQFRQHFGPECLPFEEAEFVLWAWEGVSSLVPGAASMAGAWCSVEARAGAVRVLVATTANSHLQVAFGQLR